MGDLWGGLDEIGAPGLEFGGDFLFHAASCPQPIGPLFGRTPIPSTTLSPETYNLASVSILETPLCFQASPNNGYLDFAPTAALDWQPSQPMLSTVTDSLSQLCDLTAQNALSASIQAEAAAMTTISDPLQLPGSVWAVDNVTTNLDVFWSSLDSSSAGINPHTLAERVESPSDLETLGRQPTAMSLESSSVASTSQMASPPTLVNGSPQTQRIDSSGVFSNTYMCYLCSVEKHRAYPTPQKLQQHKVRYHGVKIACRFPECPKSFSLLSDLTRHMETIMHGGKKSWGCTECDKSFARKDGMLKHFNKKHSQEPRTGTRKAMKQRKIGRSTCSKVVIRGHEDYIGSKKLLPRGEGGTVTAGDG